MSAFPYYECTCGFTAWIANVIEAKCSECGHPVQVIVPEPAKKKVEETVEIIESTRYGYKKTLRSICDR